DLVITAVLRRWEERQGRGEGHRARALEEGLGRRDHRIPLQLAVVIGVVAFAHAAGHVEGEGEVHGAELSLGDLRRAHGTSTSGASRGTAEVVGGSRPVQTIPSRPGAPGGG